jgi:hypothetical protein
MLPGARSNFQVLVRLSEQSRALDPAKSGENVDYVRQETPNSLPMPVLAAFPAMTRSFPPSPVEAVQLLAPGALAVGDPHHLKVARI